MICEVLQEPEALLAEFTLKRPFIGVGAHVLCEIPTVVELLPTLLARKGFFP